MKTKVNTDTLIRTQQELSELIGCPGREQRVREYIRSRITPIVDSVTEDQAGNLIAVKPAAKASAPTILLDAHMDEIGFIVNHIEPDGALRVSPLGGIDPSLLPGTAVQFLPVKGARISAGEPVLGTFGSIPPHAKSSLGSNSGALKIENLTVDIGAEFRQQAREMGIDLGATGTFYTPFQRLGQNSLMGKAFDNRSGCNILLHTAELIASEPIDATVMFLFSVSEEHQQLGVGSVDLPGEADIALVLENTTATDTPGTPAHFKITEMGKGPAITIADTKYIVQERVVDALTRCARRNSIPWQYKKPVYGGTNAAAVSTGGAGLPTGIVSVPCRYIHSPAAVLRIKDLEQTAALVYRFAAEYAQQNEQEAPDANSL